MAEDAAGYLQFGPYTTQLDSPGGYTAQWELLIDNNTANDALVARLDVYDFTAGQVLAQRDIRRTQFSYAGQMETFTLPFNLDAARAGHTLEFRLYWADQAYIRQQRVGVSRGVVSDNYTLQAKIKMISGKDVGLALRVSADTNFYMVRASGDPGDLGTALWRRTPTGWDRLASFAFDAAAGTPQPGESYTLKASVQGAAITWQYQRNGVLSQVYTASDSSHPTGGVGVRVSTGGGTNHHHIDDLLVTTSLSNSYGSAGQLGEVRDAAGYILAAPTYDAAGNPLGEGASSYAFDDRNRLTTASGPAGDAVYSYDAQGRLLTRTIGGATTTYRYNEATGAPLHELNAAGSVTASYVADDHGRPLTVTRYAEGVGSTYYYHYNAHGDVAAITDSQGNIVATFSYDSWGAPTELDALGNKVTLGSWTAPTGGTPGQGLYLLFGSMLYDAACGLYLTRTRAYNPRTGRFMQRDILDEEAKGGYDGFIQGRDAIDSNLYLFTGNNPVNRTDPSGMRWGDTRNWSNWRSGAASLGAFLARLAPDYAAWQRRQLAGTTVGRRIIGAGNPAPIPGYSPYGETIVYRNPYTGTGYTMSGKGYSQKAAPPRATPAPQPPPRTGSLDRRPGGQVSSSGYNTTNMGLTGVLDVAEEWRGNSISTRLGGAIGVGLATYEYTQSPHDGLYTADYGIEAMLGTATLAGVHVNPWLVVGYHGFAKPFMTPQMTADSKLTMLPCAYCHALAPEYRPPDLGDSCTR